MQAPGDTKSVGPKTSRHLVKSTRFTESGPSTWSDADVTMVYHRRKLDELLKSDPVTKTLEIRLLGKLSGPVSTLPQLRTVTEAITALVTLLREAGMVAGRFEPNDLFSLGLDQIKMTVEKLHKRLGILVGTTPAKSTPPAPVHRKTPSQDSQMTLQDIEIDRPAPPVTWNPQPVNDRSRGSMSDAHTALERSSQGSSTYSQQTRMTLGPAGAALLQARTWNDEHEQLTRIQAARGQPTENLPPDRQEFHPMGCTQGITPQFTPPRGEVAGGKRRITRWATCRHISTRRWRDFFKNAKHLHHTLIGERPGGDQKPKGIQNQTYEPRDTIRCQTSRWSQ